LAQPYRCQRIILLGSVAGGGDQPPVTAALRRADACVVPLNFGGPQPETRYPLPEDVETSFNYARRNWESTRKPLSLGCRGLSAVGDCGKLPSALMTNIRDGFLGIAR